MRLFLASGSPRRSELLSKASIPFTRIPNLFEETTPDECPIDIPSWLREVVENKARLSQATHDGLILSADTVVVHKQKLYGKPQDLEEAREMITQLSGSTHTVYTGYCLLHTETAKATVQIESAQVHFPLLSDEIIDQYLSHYEVLDKAGGYAIQDCGALFQICFEGEMSTIIGLPMNSLLKSLSGYDIVD